MESEAKQVSASDLFALAKQKVSVDGKPDWAVVREFSLAFKSGRHASATWLLLDTQLHAEKHAWFVHQAIRLETMEAVQHHSQWRLQFDPQTQQITFHSLKIWRNGEEINHLNLEKAHFLQREEGLEKFVLHGRFTLLLVLEDVRPGDVLEYSYTINNSPRLLPENNSYYFNLPMGVALGRYYFAVRFHPARVMKWKTSGETLRPVESRTDTEVLWEWSGESYQGAKPEPNTPAWFLANPWIHVSDYPDWKCVAGAVAAAWEKQAECRDNLNKVAGDIETRHNEISPRIEAAIRLVQDECRYFSSNLELGGQVPESPEAVSQRRFGDCKDLSWLLVNLLKRLGVSARPILVNSFLQKTVRELLPALSLFNHAIVEFEFEGKKFWVDTTQSSQGGGPFSRSVTNFGFGLPVDAAADDLVAAPKSSEQRQFVEVRETILLDTRGGSSMLAVCQHCEGPQADLLRHQLAQAGVEETARLRLRSVNERFHNASRVGSLQYRDDREANRIFLAETFEIRPLINPHPNASLCRFLIPVNWLGGLLVLPAKEPRTAPFFLPHPCRLHLVVEVESQAVKNMKLNNPRSNVGNAYLEFNRRERAGRGFWVMDIEAETKAGFVPGAEIEKHRQIVEQVWSSASRQLAIFKGYPRPKPKTGFGELPPVTKPAPRYLIPPTAVARLPAVPIAQMEAKTRHQSSSGRRKRHKAYRNDAFPLWLKIGLGLFAAFWFVLLGIVIAYHH